MDIYELIKCQKAYNVISQKLDKITEVINDYKDNGKFSEHCMAVHLLDVLKDVS